MKTINDELIKLKTIVRDSYINVYNYMQVLLNQHQSTFNASNTEYITRKQSIMNSSDTIPASAQQTLINALPIPSGINISDSDINTVINNITNHKNSYLQNIQNDIIKTQNSLNDLNMTESQYMTDYKSYINYLNNELSMITSRLQQNNVIMSRQQSNYDKLNNNYSYLEKQRNKIEDNDNIIQLNTNSVNDYSTNNALLVKIYLLIIFVMALCILYLAYITIKKFGKNIE